MRRAGWDRVAAIVAVAAAALLLIRGAWGLSDVPYVAVGVFALLTTIMELAPVRLPGGGRLTVSPVLDLAGLLVFGPVIAAWIALFGALAARAFRPLSELRREQLLRVTISILGIAAAGVAWRLLAGGATALRLPGHFPALIAMGVAYVAVVSVGQAIVVGRRSGQPPLHVWRTNARWSGILLIAFLPLGIVAALLYFEFRLVGVLLFVSPILLARHVFRLYTETRTDVFSFVETLTEVIEQVDPYTRHHSSRVSAYARQIAVEMGLNERRVDVVATAGLLHDLGKVSFKTADIMESPDPLTAEQRERMTRHPSIGADIVAKVRMFREVAELVRFHHERVDGGGYPYGLSGEAIPLGARILMVADTLDAMTSDRAYRRALRLDEAISEFRRYAGRQFDAEVVAAVERLVARRELRVLYDSSESTGGFVPVLETTGR